MAFGAYLLRPAPILLLTAQVSLAVGAYTLLPNAPLDGKVLVERKPALAALLGVLVASAGVAFTIAV